MAARRKKADPNGPRHVDGILHLSRLDMLELNVLHAKLTSIERERRCIDKDLRILELETQKQRITMQACQVANATSARSYQTALEQLCGKLSEKYGVDFSAVSFDDETGKITELHDQREG